MFFHYHSVPFHPLPTVDNLLTLCIYQGCCDKTQSGWLQQQSCIASWFWGAEVQNQGVGGVGPSEAVRGGPIPSRSPISWCFAGNLQHPLPCSSIALISAVLQCACHVQISPLYEDTSHFG